MKFHVAKGRVLAEKTSMNPGKQEFYVPQTVEKIYTEALVTEVGEGVTDWSVGDRVFFQKMSGFHFTYEGKELIMIPAQDILAKLTD